jgi:hypothetical protein
MTQDIRSDFDSMGDFLQWLDDTPRKWLASNSLGDSFDDFKFRGTRTMSEANDLARNGWPEGRKAMSESLSDQIARVKMDRMPRRWHDVAGAYPDVQAAIAGDPLNMISIGDDERAARPTIDILVNISCASAVSRESITLRGAAILSWVDALESAEYRVQVTGHATTKCDNRALSSAFIVLKRAQDPMDIDRLAYTMTHPSMLRRHICHFRECTPRGYESRAYGLPVNLTAQTIPDNALYFPKIEMDYTPEQAAQAARKIIAAGGLIDDENT